LGRIAEFWQNRKPWPLAAQQPLTMKLQSLPQMLLEYRISELESHDKISRDEMLLVHPYSVILEGDYLELDSLNQWIEVNLGSH
jgi:hypothetical protein